MRSLLVAALLCGVSAPALAGMSCSFTDQRSNLLQYSFARGGQGYTNEIKVMRNGATLSNGGPTWSRSFDRGSQIVTLMQDDWSLSYRALNGQDPAALYHGANLVANGLCSASVDYTPAPAPYVAPQPVYNAPPPVQRGFDGALSPPPAYADRVPVVIANSSAYATITLGSLGVTALIDTGTSSMAVPQNIADRLIANGEATEGELGESTYADGSTHTNRTIIIHSLTLGSHVVNNVYAGVSPNSGGTLLGFAVLNRISNKAAINFVNSTLDFG
jgi:hypothetical protein